jgi:hypothetical protein
VAVTSTLLWIERIFMTASVLLALAAARLPTCATRLEGLTCLCNGLCTCSNSKKAFRLLASLPKRPATSNPAKAGYPTASPNRDAGKLHSLQVSLELKRAQQVHHAADAIAVAVCLFGNQKSPHAVNLGFVAHQLGFASFRLGCALFAAATCL